MDFINRNCGKVVCSLKHRAKMYILFCSKTVNYQCKSASSDGGNRSVRNYLSNVCVESDVHFAADEGPASLNPACDTEKTDLICCIVNALHIDWLKYDNASGSWVNFFDLPDEMRSYYWLNICCIDTEFFGEVQPKVGFLCCHRRCASDRPSVWNRPSRR